MSQTPPTPTEDMDALVASMRADSSDINVFFAVLCAKLMAAIPDSVEVMRQRGLFKRKSARPVRRIVVHAGDDLFEADLNQGSVTCRHTHTVHGVGGGLPFSKELSFDQWLRTLFQALAQRAESSAAVSAALRSLVT